MATCKQVLIKTGYAYATRQHAYIYDELQLTLYELLLCSLVNHRGVMIADLCKFSQAHAPGAHGRSLAK